MTHDNWNVNDSSHDDVDKAFREYLRIIESGEEWDKETFLSQYPEIREELARLIDTDQQLRQPAKTVIGGPPEPGPTGDLDSDETDCQIPEQLGDFRILRRIGRGGMGEVYLAEQLSVANKFVAIKILPGTATFDSRRLRRFKNEIAAAGGLEHDHIVPIITAGEDQGTHYFAMKYIDGVNLSALISLIVAESPTQSEGSGSASRDRTDAASGKATVRDPLPEQLVELGTATGSRARRRYYAAIARIIATISEALHYAHEEGIVHRDVKPANLMLDRQGHAWVMDFGLAQVQTSPSETMTGTLLGTLRYMSPEQAYAKRVTIDHRTDVYSLGVTLYELLTLTHAFTGDSQADLIHSIAFDEPTRPRRIRRDLPAELATITLKAMSKKPDERYQTANDLASDLRRYLNNEPIIARPPTLTKRISKWVIRHRPVVAMASVVMVSVLAAIGAVMAGNYRHAQQTAKQEQEARERFQKQNIKLQNEVATAESRRFAALSALELDKNPGEAVRLARQGDRIKSGLETKAALFAAMDKSHELLRIDTGAAAGFLDLNPDGKQLVSTTPFFGTEQVYPATLWNTDTGEKLGTLASEHNITSAVFSSGGQRILTASSPPFGRGQFYKPRFEGERLGHDPEVWDARTYQKLYSLKDCFIVRVHPGCFSPSGRRIVAPARGNKATIFDAIEGTPIHDLSGHTKRVTYASFSPSGKRIVTVSEDNTVRVWDSTSGNVIATLDFWQKANPETKERILDRAVFHPEEDKLITESPTYGIQVWEIATQKSLLQDSLRGDNVHLAAQGDILIYGSSIFTTEIRNGRTAELLHKIEGRFLAKSPNDEYVAVAHSDHNVDIHRILTGERVASLRGHKDRLHFGCFNADSTEFYTASQDRIARRWNIKSGKERRFIGPKFDNPYITVEKYDDKHILVYPVMTARTSIWDIEARKELDTRDGYCAAVDDDTRLIVERTQTGILKNLRDPVGTPIPGWYVPRISAMSDASGIAVLQQHQTPWWWNYREGELQPILGHKQRVNAVTFHPDGSEFATGSADGSVRIFDSSSRLELGVLRRVDKVDGPIESVDYHPSGNRLVTCTSLGSIIVWNRATLAPILALESQPDQPRAAHFSPDGNHIVSHHHNRSRAFPVTSWDGNTGARVRRINDFGPVRDVAFHPTDSVIAIASHTDGATTCNYLTGERQQLSPKPTSHAVFSKDGSTVVTSTAVPTDDPLKYPLEVSTRFPRPVVEVWKSNGELIGQLPGLRGAIDSLRISGNRLVLTENRYDAHVYNFETGQLTRVYAGHAAPLSFCGRTADKKHIVMASWDGSGTVLHADTGTIEHELVGHAAPIVQAAMNRDTLFTGSTDGEVRNWNVQTGKPGDVRDKYANTITHIRFDPCGERIVTAALDGEMRIQDLTTGRITQVHQGEGIADLAFSPDGTRLAVALAGHLQRAMKVDGTVELTIRHTPRSREVRVYNDTVPQRLVLQHSSNVSAVRWSPSGHNLLTVCGRTSSIWNAHGPRTQQIEHDTFAVVAWIDNSRVVADDKLQTLIWDIDLQRLDARIPRGRHTGGLPPPLRGSRCVLAIRATKILVYSDGHLEAIPATATQQQAE